MTTEQRLNHIEDEFETVKQLLASAARYAESANETGDRNTRSIEQLSEKINQLNEAQQQTQTHLDLLSEKVDRLTNRVDRLAERVDEFVFQAQRLFTQLGEQQSRTEATVQTLVDSVTRLTRNSETTQAEILRIWQYLEGQQRNGHQPE